MKAKKTNARRIICAATALCMILSLAVGLDLTASFRFGENVSAAASGGEETETNEYANETLENIWGNGPDDANNKDSYWNAARPYYSGYAIDIAQAKTSEFQLWSGVRRTTIFHVYAFEGETICLGSSVYNSGLDIDHKYMYNSQRGASKENYEATEKDHTPFEDVGSVDIVMTDLKGNKIPIDIRNSEDTELGETEVNTTGYISSPQVEYAAVKMKMNTDGTFDATYKDSEGKEYTYTPYTYKVKESGVYTFQFHSYDKIGGTVNALWDRRGEQFPTGEHNYIGKNGSNYYDTGGLIAALNITVFDENCEKQTGRAYADALALQMDPANDKINSTSFNNGVRDSYYVLTTDSYIYKMKFNDISPYSYNFFANNRGIYDNSSPTQETVYKSVKDTSNSNEFGKMGTLFVDPGSKETDKDKSFFIFLEYPDSDLEGEIYRKATLPDPATNIRFEGTVIENGEKVTGTYTGAGGWFSFDIKEATTATLRLEFKNKLEKYAPVEITGPVTPNSPNAFYWDGRDGNGVLIPEGVYDFNDIMYTVTAKAGEIHFPITDMENATGGITFTGMSHIYDKEGKRLDYDDNVYGKTKNVIYYDETAIYYGEMVAGKGTSEDQVTLGISPANDSTYLVNDAPKNFFKNLKPEDTKRYWTYNNMRSSGGGEYQARNSSGGYAPVNDDSKIRIGDHSHTTNVIPYFDDKGEVLDYNELTQDQKNMITYLDSSKNPVGKSPGTGIYLLNNNSSMTNAEKYTYDNVVSAQTTTDYAIANFWAFIPAKPATTVNTKEQLHIVEKPEKVGLFNLSGRVFYDANKNGFYDDSGSNGEHMLSGVKLKLYKQTTDTTAQIGKEYYKYTTGTNAKIEKATDFSAEYYELVDEKETGLDGAYIFTNLQYDKDDGTNYLYEVIRPDLNYDLTSDVDKSKPSVNVKVNAGVYYGYYANHSYDTNGKGTEIQLIKIGGTNGVDPTRYSYDDKPTNPNNSVCAVDVGYHYDLFDKKIKLVKNWQTTDPKTPDTAVFELSYLTDIGRSAVYDYYTLSAAGTWQKNDEFIPNKISGSDVKEYFVSAEYIIHGDYIYKYTFNFNAINAMYDSFTSTAQRVEITKLVSTADVETFSITDILDYNNDGKSDAADLGAIESTLWEPFTENGTDTYRAVIDRNVLSDSVELTIDNSQNHGTIEIFKYHDDDSHPLQGATFRLYKATMDDTMANVGDQTWVNEHFVGSGTTRVNGRLAFSGLDPNATYTVREMYAPDGYRIVQEYYEVRPKTGTILTDEENVYKFDKDDYAKFAVGNVPADSTLRIRKRISGRAWQDGTTGSTEDLFTFEIGNGFDAASTSNLAENTDIKVDLDEQKIYDDDSAKILQLLNDFADHFQGTSAEHTITINSSSPYYFYTDSGKTYTSADTKMTDELLKDYDAVTNPIPTFMGVKFPMAGVYNFTVNEKNFDEKLNLEKSNLIYKVTVNVSREYNDKEDEEKGLDKTTVNTHLQATVSNITYSEDGTTFKSYASSSPLFTNSYKPAPAVQTTSYKIKKDLSGREWTDDDNFTVEITPDLVTAEAIKNGNLKITGFEGTVSDLTAIPDGKGWTYTFNKDNNDTALEFKSFKFKDIIFPVEYVNKDDSEDVKDSLTEEEVNSGNYEARTLPVTYTFTIEEHIPTDAEDNVLNGITYDDSKYTLTIKLNNTETNKVGTGEEEDGIIEEIDVTLSKIDKSGTVYASKCVTRQSEMTRDEWGSAVKDDNTTYWYVHPDTKELKERPINLDTVPTTTKLYIKKVEKHTTTSDSVFGDDGHTMTIKNVYNTSYSWQPMIRKTVSGREWLDDDKFTFKIELTDGEKDNVTISKETLEITNKSTTIGSDGASYQAVFDEILFTAVGDYKFTITETDRNGTQLGSYTVTVSVVDNGDGTLEPTITDAAGNLIPDPVIEFVNTYSDTDFTLDISKKIIGREWCEGDSFTFNIEPDSVAKTAIESNTIVMPSELTVVSGGSYSAAVGYDDLSTEEPKSDTATKSFGEITIKNTGALVTNQQYKFTISEVTSKLKSMYCREPSFDLTVTVDSNTAVSGKDSSNTLVATYAHIIDGKSETITPIDGKVTIPFENVATSKLTVAKKVVSSSEKDNTEFAFKVTFTYGDDMTEKDLKIKAKKGGKEIELTESVGKTWTYKFTLKDGEKVEFTDIPTGTLYEVEENIDEHKDKYMLLRVRGSEEDSGENLLESGENSVSGEIDESEVQPYLMFVNGKITQLPSAGGKGVQWYILIGALFTAVSLGAVVILRRRKNNA